MPCISTEGSGPKKIGSYYEVNFIDYVAKKLTFEKTFCLNFFIKNSNPFFGSQSPKQQSDWRPALGYENVDVTPLPAHPTTNQLVQVSNL